MLLYYNQSSKEAHRTSLLHIPNSSKLFHGLLPVLLSELLKLEGSLANASLGCLIAFSGLGEVIAAALPVTVEYMSREEAASIVDLSKLPEDVSETLRIVRIGDYDDCACIGAHVGNTSEIGEFRIISHDFNYGSGG